MTTKVIHVNDEAAFLPGMVYIGRRINRARNPIAHVTSPWHNPFRVGDPHPISGQPMTVDDAVALFDAISGDDATHVLSSLRQVPALHRDASAVSDHVRANVGDLRDRVLVCWCAPIGRSLTARHRWICHGQPLAARAENA